MNTLLPDAAPVFEILEKKKKVFFAGAMGTGKTEIAVNFAGYWSRMLNSEVGLVDLDMVKPYFRLRSLVDEINLNMVEVVIPDRIYGQMDFPMIPAYLEAWITDMNRRAIIDLGGDDIGARLAGRYSGVIDPEKIEFWYVFNGRRPLSRGADNVLEIMDSIERACHFKLTGLVHNSHLMNETKVSDLTDKIEQAEKIAEEKGIPLLFHCIREDLYEEASKELPGLPLMPLKINIIPIWE